MAVGPKVSLYGSVLITPGKTTIFAYTYDTISCTVSKKSLRKIQLGTEEINKGSSVMEWSTGSSLSQYPMGLRLLYAIH